MLSGIYRSCVYSVQACACTGMVNGQWPNSQPQMDVYKIWSPHHFNRKHTITECRDSKSRCVRSISCDDTSISMYVLYTAHTVCKNFKSVVHTTQQRIMDGSKQASEHTCSLSQWMFSLHSINSTRTKLSIKETWIEYSEKKQTHSYITSYIVDVSRRTSEQWHGRVDRWIPARMHHTYTVGNIIWSRKYKIISGATESIFSRTSTHTNNGSLCPNVCYWLHTHCMKHQQQTRTEHLAHSSAFGVFFFFHFYSAAAAVGSVNELAKSTQSTVLANEQQQQWRWPPSAATASMGAHTQTLFTGQTTRIYE